jgi:hypothetical protein
MVTRWGLRCSAASRTDATRAEGAGVLMIKKG